MRRLAYLASVVLVLSALIAVPMPFAVFSPGEAVDLRGAVSVEGQGEVLSGPLSLVTIRSKEAGLLDVLRAWVDGDRDLIDRDLVYGQGGDADEYYEASRTTFGNQLDVSTIAALRELGQELGAGQLVVEVVANTPADGVLLSGDILRSIDGEVFESLEQLRAALDEYGPGDQVVIGLDRDAEPIELAVTVDVLPDSDRVGLGVQLRTHVDGVPIEVTSAPILDPIGGPSAGLVLALAIHDLLSPDDLVRGRAIAATGTMDVDGRVGNIGGIHQKVAAAEEAGVELLLVPLDQVAAARARARSVRIVGVGSLAEALAVLADG